MEPTQPPTLGKMDYAKLLGFDGVGGRISGSVDFQNETIGAKLGAKVGGAEPGTPVKLAETVGSIQATCCRARKASRSSITTGSTT